MRRGIAGAGMLSLVLAGGSPAAQEDVVLQAMKDELTRSMSKLRLEELKKPYFISYKVDETTVTQASASFGSALSRDRDRQRWLTVEVRVGDYKLDNTNFFSMPSGRSGVLRIFGGRVPLILDDDYGEIRRRLWLATDAVYKEALENLSRKEAALRNRTRAEEIADFSPAEPTTLSQMAPRREVDPDEAAALVRGLSTLFREMPDVFSSSVSLRAATVSTRYVNSEGSTYTRISPSVSLVARAETQAADGLPLSDFVAVHGRNMGELPSCETLSEAIRQMGRRLSALRVAPLIKRYNGPVLFEGQAAAELFAQAFAPALLASPAPVMENERMARFMRGRQGETLEDKIGARVLPRFLQVRDDPTLTRHADQLLLGGYGVDDEGVRAQPTQVVERGILKTLLTGRAPVPGVEKSTGNRRSGRVLPSNVVVTADGGLSADGLKQELLLLMKERDAEFGIVVRRLGNPEHRRAAGGPMSFFGPSGAQQSRVEGAIEAYKVYPDGREELVRNLEISGIVAATFKEIVAASEGQTVYTAPFSARPGAGGLPFSFFGGQSGGSPLASWVVPSLLFEDITLKKPSGEIPKPPVAPHPFFDRPPSVYPTSESKR